MIAAFISIADMLLQLLTWLIIASVIMSWLVAFNVINLQQPFVRGLYTTLERILAPVYRPIRRLLPDFGGLDFSPLVVLLAANVLRKLLFGLLIETGPTIT